MCWIEKYEKWTIEKPYFPENIDDCCNCNQNINKCFDVIKTYINNRKKETIKEIKK